MPLPHDIDTDVVVDKSHIVANFEYLESDKAGLATANAFTEINSFAKYQSLAGNNVSISSDQNDYELGTATLLTISTDAARTVTGFVAQSGAFHFLVNRGSNNLIIAHESASSTANNRVIVSSGANLTLEPGYGVVCWYDLNANRWRVLLPDLPRNSVATLTDAATIATNAALAETFNISSATDRTLGVPTGAMDGMKRLWRWTNTDSSSHTLTLASGAGGFAFGSGVTSIPATADGATTVIGAIYSAASDRWQVVAHDVF